MGSVLSRAHCNSRIIIYFKEIQHSIERIKQSRDEIYQLIIKRINDREHANVYNDMLENKIADLRNYDEVCKKRREELRNTSELLETVLAEGQISNVNLQMLVRQVTVHQNDDKSIGIKFEMNGSFNNGSEIEIEPD